MVDYFFFVTGYLLGSIPSGLLLSKAMGYGDIRKIGSGNIGATNVLRTGNKKLAALTLLADILKGAVAVWISFASGNAAIILITGLCAILGHMYPAWLEFKGGKGVATTFGVIFALMPPLGLAIAGIWISMALALRISSLAALTAVGLAPFLSFFWLHDLYLMALTLVIAGLVFWKHKENIERLRAGTEPKINFKKEKDAPPTPEE